MWHRRSVARRDIDEEVVRGRRDPRREESLPPEERTSARPAEVREIAEPLPPVTVGPTLQPDPRPERTDPTPEAPPSSRKLPALAEKQITGRVISNVDPRLEEVEGLLRANDWDGVLRALGPADQAGRLPPNLGLLYAIARKEKETSTDKGSDATDLAIRCAAGLLGVAPESPLALVVAKRIVRKNPVAWQKAPAPPARVSAMIMLAALAIGGAIGWLVATGRVRFYF
jgi:hypothetical protein